MQSRMSSLRSYKGVKNFQESADNQSEKSQKKNAIKTEKKNQKGGKKCSLLRFDSGTFVIRKIHSFDNDYDVVGQIGQGSFGTVYKVQHKALKIERALKKIKKSDSKQKFSSFQEIQVLKKLDHNNILKIYEFYETDQFYFIITDIFYGKELFDEIIDSQKLTEEIAAKILKEIIITLNYSHSQGIAHRDIKPQNILVQNIHANNIKLKIIDWGLGTLIDNKGSNRVCGTPEYAAPQVFKGKYSLQCDMWSLGVLAFIMLTGNMPFKGKKTQETIRSVQRGIINFRKTGFLDLSSQAKQFITSLIQKDPLKRMTPAQALEHPWIIKNSAPKKAPVFLKQTLERLKTFNVNNRIGAAVVNFVNNHFSSTQQKEKLEEIFKYLDKNGDGVLSSEQLIQGYSQIYGKALAQKIAEQTFKKLDVNQSGTLQYSEFVAYGLERSKQNEKNRLSEAFKLFDKDKNGCISWTQVGEILEGKIEGMSEEVLKNLISEFDQNGDHEIDFDQFYKFLSNIFDRLQQNEEKQQKIEEKEK